MQSMARPLYLIAWLALAAVALGYFVFLFNKTVNRDSAETMPKSLAENSVAPTNFDTSDPAVAQAITRMGSEIERLKNALDASHKENTALRAHLKTMEAAFGPATAALPPDRARPKAPVSKTPRVVETPDTTKPDVQVQMMPMPTTGFPEEIQASPLPLARKGAARRTQFAVELDRRLSAKAIEEKWREISERHGRLLKGLEARRTPGIAANSYNLIVGPFKNAAAAALMCARLSILRMKCTSTTFSGEPLGNVARR